MLVTRSVVPNLFTLGNLFCGVAAIIAAAELDFNRAALFVLGAGVFDMLDGIVARLTRSTSEFGVELDSLCDAVSFGAAPAVYMYFISFHAWSQWGLLVASFPAMAGVLRLARFNVQLTSMEDKLYFRGMPIPAGAFTILSYAWLWRDSVPAEWRGVVDAAVTIVVSLTMVSTIKYDNLPRPTMRSFRQRPVIFLVFCTGLVAAILTKGSSIFPFMMLYLAFGAIRHGVSILRARRDEEDADTMAEEADPDPFEL